MDTLGHTHTEQRGQQQENFATTLDLRAPTSGEHPTCSPKHPITTAPPPPLEISVESLQCHLSDAAQATRAAAMTLTRMLLSGGGHSSSPMEGGSPLKSFSGENQGEYRDVVSRRFTIALQNLLEGSKPLMQMWDTTHEDIPAGE